MHSPSLLPTLPVRPREHCGWVGEQEEDDFREMVRAMIDLYSTPDRFWVLS